MLFFCSFIGKIKIKGILWYWFIVKLYSSIVRKRLGNLRISGVSIGGKGKIFKCYGCVEDV